MTSVVPITAALLGLLLICSLIDKLSEMKRVRPEKVGERAFKQFIDQTLNRHEILQDL